MLEKKTRAAFVEPTLLLRTEKLPEGPDWLYEGRNHSLVASFIHSLRDQTVPQRFHEIRKLKRLANKTADLWSVNCG